MARHGKMTRHKKSPGVAQAGPDEREVIFLSRLIADYWRPVLLVAAIVLAYQPAWRARFIWTTTCISPKTRASPGRSDSPASGPAPTPITSRSL
ncbi:MAG TPA: hypothetical protein VL981_02735 [Candidatus Methylacidiphilales bacterium]|nr:hypothetical protein [Candidatus Methylacidiphilales bacterium]